MTLSASVTSRFAPVLALLLMLLTAPVLAAPPAGGDATGVLLLTPDRGFLGNQEIRDAFEVFARDRNAALLYITDARSEAVLDERLASLRDGGATRVVALPLVVSASDARWQLAQGWLGARRDAGLKLAIAAPYGKSYLAVEDLSARLREAPTSHPKLLLVGHGADTLAAADVMQTELARMGTFASTAGAGAIRTAVYPARHASEQKALLARFQETLAATHDALVVPVAFAARDDNMMAFPNWFAGDLAADTQLLRSPIATTDALVQWMQRATTQAAIGFQPLDAQEIGIVALAHGADWFWNRDLRRSLAPVVAGHSVAFAFTMADPPVIERAVGQLESRPGIRGIVVVRAFGMASSFLPAVERMLGADVEGGGMPGHAEHDMMAMHGMDMGHAGVSLAAEPRIRSALPIVTVGGVEDSALFANALLQNARSVSRDPANETVILVAHGHGSDSANRHWVELLESLATQMHEAGDNAFRAIRYATWREDWSDKRKVEVNKVRRMVEEITAAGGRALIVPARINGRGPADRFLQGLDYGWSQGFAQTPNFAQWFEQEIRLGSNKLNGQARPAHHHGM